MVPAAPVVVVTGANGLVGTAVCRALVERSVQVRAVVRRAGSAPALDGVTEHGVAVSLATMSRAITTLPADDPAQVLTPSGRRRRPGRPLKQKA